MGTEDEELPDWRAELRREHGLTLRPARPPAAAPDPGEAPPAQEDGDWRAELLREAGVSPGARDATAIAALVAPAKAWSIAVGFDPRQVPADFDAYQAALHRLSDGPRNALGAALAREPYMRSAYMAWADGDHEARLNVVYEVFRRIGAAMGPLFRFHPAPLGYEPAMRHCDGLYSEQHRRVMLAERLLGRSFTDVVDVIVHEQIHKLQHEMYLRTHWPSRWPLSLEERALVYYWVREEPRYRMLAAQGLADVAAGRGDARYRRIAREYHAYDVAEFVAATVARVAARGLRGT